MRLLKPRNLPTIREYLKEFRTEQCPLFLQHKCTQHRPFTCFHWHFLNQRRRRPIRRRDGTFNYSPDVYCTKYDETTGICPDGDDCPYLHRTTGDTERKYHLRYYKTGTCIHETDARGHCVKNGLHCAFAHGPHDLRPPVYDIRATRVPTTTTAGIEGEIHGSSSTVFSTLTSTTSSADVARLFRELDEAKRKIKQWEEAWHQVKQACEACQKDALEAKEQAKTAEAERQLAEQKWEETERKLKELQRDFDMLCRTPGTPLLRSYGELEQLPLSKLHSIQSQLRNDLDLIDGVRKPRSHTFHL
ncbi:hypothetical protein GOODEAATRI_006650 [Goodea atripinnis]|uniref:C3H1-type domain-containing protein n=1 Tax=Goodea atripinnis TaxID=208336 RepID=A0ABV0PBY6_9TELE